MAGSEKYMSIHEAAKGLPGRPHISSVHRWSLKGVNGVKLKTVMIGHRRYVTQEAIDEFIKQLNTTDAERLASEGC